MCNLKDRRSLLIKAFVIVIITTIVQLVGFSTPLWIKWSFGQDEDFYMGLWTSCDKIRNDDSRSICKFADSLDAMTAVRVIEVTAFAIYLMTALCMGKKIFCMDQKEYLSIMAIFGCFFGAVCALIGVLGYGIGSSILLIAEHNLHFSFAMCTIAGIGGLCAGILLCISKCTQ